MTEKVDAGSIALTSGLGVGTGYATLSFYTAHYEVTIIQQLFQAVFLLWLFAFGCFTLACGLGLWLLEDKQTKKWSAMISYGFGSFSQGIVPVLGAYLMVSLRRSSLPDLASLANQYLVLIGLLGLAFLAIGAIIIGTKVD